MTDTTQTWSVVTASEGHPDNDPGTTYSVSATGLTLDAALELVSDIEHEADEAYDDCDCEPSEVDGDIRCRCTGYPIVSAFHCLDAEARKYVPDGRITIGDQPAQCSSILPHYEMRKPFVTDDTPLWAYKPSYPNGPILSVPLPRREARRRYIRSAPRDGSTILVGRPGVGEWLVKWDEYLVNASIGNYPGMWVTVDGTFTWQDHPDLGPSYWRSAC